MESLFEHSMSLKRVVEALVFASPKPLTTKEILSALKSAGNPDKTDDAAALEYAKTKEAGVEAVLAEIAEEMSATGRSFRLMEQVNGWSLVTDPAAVHWVRQLYPEAKPARLTGPQLETLAIIAYRQPVTRADIEAVRGVAVDSVVQALMERSLIKIAGRAEVPGRPLLYETTEYFLQHFGLKHVSELPNSQELKRVELPKAPVPEEPAKKAAGDEKKAAEEAPPKEEIAAEQAQEAPAAASEPDPVVETAPDEAEPEGAEEPDPEPAEVSAPEQPESGEESAADSPRELEQP